MAKVAAIAKLVAAEGKQDELRSALQDLVTAVGEEPGTLVYALNVDQADPKVFWFYELYADADAAKAHSSGTALREAGAKLGGLLGGAPEIHRLEPVAAQGLSL